MKRRLSVFLCLILVLALLAGCGQEPPPIEPPEPSASSQPTAPPPTEPPPLTEPITVVSGVVYDSPYGFQLLNRYTAGVIRFEYPDGYFEDSEAYLDIVNLYNGTVTATTALEDSEFFSSQSPENGLLLVANYERNHFRLLDAELNTVRTIQVPNTSGLFNADLSKYYSETDGILSVLDTATGISAPVSAAADYRFSSLDAFDPRTNTILGMIRTSLYSYDTASIVINPDTGELLLLSEIYGIVGPTASGICSEVYDEETMAPSFRYSDLNAGTFFEIPSQILGGFNTYLSTVSNSDYFLATAYSEEATTACDIYHIGETVTAYSLDMTAFPEGLLSLAEAPDGNLVGMQRYGDGYCFCILCPDQLPFEEVCQPDATEIPLVDPSVMDTLAAEQHLPLPEELAEVRARADALEETYGIRILLSSQCEIPASHCGFPVTTTDQAEGMDEVENIKTSLNDLEAALRLYPEGFFKQFRNEAGEYGILVLLVAGFDAPNNAIGVAYSIGEWYCVAIDVYRTYSIGTYCHEFWHAAESRIHSIDYSLLDEETWKDCNPEGFTYSYEDGLGYLDDWEWTFLNGGCGTESYFVDAYSRVNEKEDRARLMEYVMAEEDIADELMTAPALRKKLQLMCDALRQTFDTSGWENVCWERYFSES